MMDVFKKSTRKQSYKSFLLPFVCCSFATVAAISCKQQKSGTESDVQRARGGSAGASGVGNAAPPNISCDHQKSGPQGRDSGTCSTVSGIGTRVPGENPIKEGIFSHPLTWGKTYSVYCSDNDFPNLRYFIGGVPEEEANSFAKDPCFDHVPDPEDQNNKLYYFSQREEALKKRSVEIANMHSQQDFTITSEEYTVPPNTFRPFDKDLRTCADLVADFSGATNLAAINKGEMEQKYPQLCNRYNAAVGTALARCMAAVQQADPSGRSSCKLKGAAIKEVRYTGDGGKQPWIYAINVTVTNTVYAQ